MTTNALFASLVGTFIVVVYVVLLACFHGDVGPSIRVLTPDWSKVCFLR
jgi:hypothetical protein